MRIELIIYGIIGIVAVNLIFLLIIQNRKIDRGLKNYFKNHTKD